MFWHKSKQQMAPNPG